MQVNKIDHISIAVNDLEQARKVWEPVLGKSGPDDEYIDEPEKIKVARYWLGEVGFELMESTSPDGDVAKFIQKRGQGIHHIALEVDNIQAELDRLKAKGLKLINEKPYLNAHEELVAFIHPKSTFGMLVELIQTKPE